MSTQVRTNGDEEMQNDERMSVKSEQNNKFSDTEHIIVPIIGKKV